MRKPFKVGVVGAGRMGSLHLRKLSTISAIEIAGIYDPHASGSPKIVEKKEVIRFATLEELAFESDGVIVASPTPTHFAVTKKLLELGVDVLVEKPMCETAIEAEVLVKLARDKKRILQVGFLERFRLRKLLAEAPAFSPTYVTTERFTTSVGREPSLDVVSDLMIHDLDLVFSIFPVTATEVLASGVSVVTDCTDIARARLMFPGGHAAFLSANRISEKSQRKVSVARTGMQVSMDFLENEITIFERGQTPRFIKLSGVDPLFEELSDFVAACSERRSPLVSGEDAVQSLRMRDAILEAMKSPVTREISKPSEVGEVFA